MARDAFPVLNLSLGYDSSMCALTSAGRGLNAVVVGLGRAGVGLHIPILAKIHANHGDASPFGAVVGLVDASTAAVQRAVHRLEDDFAYDLKTVRLGASLEQLTDLDRTSSVVHICTPADDHAQTLRIGADLGFRRFVVEKPCAGNSADVDAMRRIVDRTGISVAVVNPYLYSQSVEACKKKIEAHGELPRYLEFELSKPRKEPTLSGRSQPESVIDVELPHQIATALYLTGAEEYRVLRAEVRHMHYRREETEPCRVVLNMGLGVIILELGHCIAVLVSYLDAPTRTRVLKLRFADTEQIEAFLPVTEDDHTSEVTEYYGKNADGSTDQHSSRKLSDDLFTRCLSDIYSCFLSERAHASDITFNRRVVDIMDKAKALARVRR